MPFSTIAIWAPPPGQGCRRWGGTTWASSYDWCLAGAEDPPQRPEARKKTHDQRLVIVGHLSTRKKRQVRHGRRRVLCWWSLVERECNSRPTPSPRSSSHHPSPFLPRHQARPRRWEQQQGYRAGDGGTYWRSSSWSLERLFIILHPWEHTRGAGEPPSTAPWHQGGQALERSLISGGPNVDFSTRINSN
jgi:hypothetical protein